MPSAPMSNVSASARLRSIPAVATLIAERGPPAQGTAAAPATWAEGPHFADVQQLIASGVVPAAVFMTPADAHQAATWLEALRRNARLALVPVVLPRSFGAYVDALSDGVAPRAGASAELAAEIAARAAALGKRETADGDERLLAFLY